MIKDLIKLVREERSKLDICPSAKSDISISNLLQQIIDNEVYKSDYNDITLQLLFKPISYKDAIESIQIIIESEIFN